MLIGLVTRNASDVVPFFGRPRQDLFYVSVAAKREPLRYGLSKSARLPRSYLTKTVLHKAVDNLLPGE